MSTTHLDRAGIPCILVRTNSHRARQRLHCAIGRKPQYFYTFADGAKFAGVTAAELSAALAVPTITTARPKGDVLMCW